MTTLFNFKISEALKSELQKTQEKAGLKQEDFISAMLARFKESQADIDIASPIYKELAKVKQIFAQGERLVCSLMESAANDKIEAEKKAQEKVGAAGKKIAELEKKIQGLKERNQNHEDKISEQGEIISALQKKADNLKAKKAVWSEKENELNARITELHAEIKESRDLKDEIQAKETIIANRINEISKLERKLVLADQKSESDQALIEDLNNRVDTLQCEISNLEEKLTGAQATVSSKEFALQTETDEIPPSNAEEYDLSTGTVFSIEQDVIDLEGREFKRKSVAFEIDILVGDRLIKTNMKNISAGGVLLKTKESIEKDKKAKMVFSIPGVEKPFKLEGRVVRSTESGIAIKFDEVSPDFQSLLNEKIWHPLNE
nr:PilZ domain-containing protein [uncultured Desulfobacter sp.]